MQKIKIYTQIVWVGGWVKRFWCRILISNWHVFCAWLLPGTLKKWKTIKNVDFFRPIEFFDWIVLNTCKITHKNDKNIWFFVIRPVPLRTDDKASTINFWFTPHKLAVKFWHFLWQLTSQSDWYFCCCWMKIENL